MMLHPPQAPESSVSPLLPGTPIEQTAQPCPVPDNPEPAEAEFDASWDPFAPDDFDADAEGADWSWFSDPPGPPH